jgi:hypothetical protein
LCVLISVKAKKIQNFLESKNIQWLSIAISF